jgi:HSP20 family molecular chaperone IbpA
VYSIKRHEKVKMTKHMDSTISLLDAVDKIFDTAVWSNTYISYPYDNRTYYQYSWPTIITNIPKIDVPAYPVSNGWLKEDGSMYLQIACTGFTKNDIQVKAEDNVLIIDAEVNIKERAQDIDSKQWKELFHNLKIKPFEWKRRVSSKYDLTRLEAVMANGLLTITIPLKEDAKPIKKSFEIK